MGSPEFWSDQDEAQKVVREASLLKQRIESWSAVSVEQEEVEILLELAEIEVSVPADGTYQLWARLFGPDGNSDAAYVTVGNAPWSRKWPSTTGVYEWVKIASYDLKKGTHQLKASHGEIKARFDAFFLADDPNRVPPESKPQ
jgi:hypothetical protein